MDFARTQSEAERETARLQSAVPGLCFHGSGQAISTGPLIPGCDICTRGAYMCFQIGFRCNTACSFCFLHTYTADAPDPGEEANRRMLLDQFYRSSNELEGVALTGGEPLLYLRELEACVCQMREAKPGLHFWTYTNGILANEERLDFVRGLGIAEIRFNLAATDYDRRVLRNIENARRLFQHVAVEVPSYPKQKDRLIGCLDELQRIGIDQLNLQELLVTDANADKLEGELYQSGILALKRFFVYGSRRMTYEVMQHCVEKGYTFTVNDCSAADFGAR